MHNGQHLIRRAIADLQLSATGTVMCRAVNTAYAKGLIEMAYAEALIGDAQYDEFNRQVHQVELDSREVACA